LLNLVEQDLNKSSNNKNSNIEGKGEEGIRVVIPLNNDDIHKANLSPENKIENKKNKTEKESKDAANIGNSEKIIEIFLIKKIQ